MLFGLEVYIATGGNTETDRIYTFHQSYAPVDGVVLEYEWWANSPRDFDAAMAILDYAKAKNPSWVVGAYIGQMQANADLNLDEYHKLTLHADYILIHSYNDSPTKAFNYAKARLTEFARCTNKTPIIPLLSTEWRDDTSGSHVICDAGPSNPEYYNRMCFLGKWLETHQLPEAEAIYTTDYNNWSLKTSVNLQDAFAYFAYTHTKLNSGWLRLPTTLTIQSRSTTSDSVLIVRSSPITCTIQSLSSTPTNTPWGVRRNLTLERTSESVTNLTNIKSRKEISFSVESTTSSSTPEVNNTFRVSMDINSSSSTSDGAIQVPPDLFVNCHLLSTVEVGNAAITVERPIEVVVESTSSTSSAILYSPGIVMLEMMSNSTTVSSVGTIAKTAYLEVSAPSALTTSEPEFEISGSLLPTECIIESLSSTSPASIPCKIIVRLDADSTSETSSGAISLEKGVSLVIESTSSTSGSWTNVKAIDLTLVSESQTSSATLALRKNVPLALTSSLETSEPELLRTIQIAFDAESTLTTSEPNPLLSKSLEWVMTSTSSSSEPPLSATDYLTLAVSSNLVTGDAAFVADRPIATTIVSSVETSAGEIVVSRSISCDILSALTTSEPRIGVIRPNAFDLVSESTTSAASITNKKKISMTILSLTDTSIATIDRLMNCRLDLQSAANDVSVPLGMQIYTEAVINSVSTTSGVLATHALKGMVPRVRVL